MTQPIDTAYVDIVARDKSLTKLRKDIDKTFDDVNRDIKKSLDEIDSRFEETFVDIDTHLKTMTVRTKRSFDDVSDSAESAFARIKKRFQVPLQQGFTKLTEIISDVGRTLGQVGSGLGNFASSSPLLVLILALTPAIIALAAALSQLIGVVGIIPAGLGVLLAAIIPVVVAFQNFGDAVSALAEGDVDKINEALKKLSPSAGAVAKEIAALLPMLRSFQRVVQEGFFAPLVGDFTNVVRNLFPTLEKGFFQVARSMGRLTSSFAELAAAPKTMQVLQQLFASTSGIIDRLIGPFRRFADMLLNSVGAGLPFVERLAGAFGRALDAFSNFVNVNIADGDFNAFVEDAITTIKELIDLVKAVGGLLGTIFGGTEDAGHDLIKMLTDLVVSMDNFFKSADGQDTLEALSVAARFLGSSLQFTFGVFANSVLIFKSMLKFFNDVGVGFVAVVTTIIDWVKKIPEAVTTFLDALPGRVAAIFQGMFDRVLQIIGIGVGMALFAIQVLPEKIGEFLVSLPERIYAIFLRVGPLVADALQGAVNLGRNILVNGFESLVEFIRSVPERIKGLVPNFANAGGSLIKSFMNAFRSVGGFISDVAGDIVGAIKRVVNGAIDRINVGIAKVDDVVPGSLGRIPRLAEGAFVPRRPGGILANVGEGREDEWVLPQSKLDAIAAGGGSNITFGPDAINISFAGVVPTVDEARAVGAAVGQGIISMISKRNMRVQVRAV